MTEIVEVKDFIPAYTDAVQKLLEQLTNRGKTDRDNPQRDHIPRKHPSVFLTG